MKRFCLRLVMFSLLFFISYPVILVLWGFMAPDFFKSNLHTEPAGGYTHLRLTEMRKVSHPDILFLGSSHAYRGFDSRIFKRAGYKVFNLGTSAQKIPVTEFLLRRYLNRIHPKLIVFSIDPSMLRGKALETVIDLTYSDSLGWDMIQLVKNEADIRGIHALLWKVTAEVGNLDLHLLNKKSATVDRYISGGYVENISLTEKPGPKIHTEKLRSDYLASFERCLALIRENQIPYVLLTTPFTKPYYQLINRISYDSIFANYGRYRDFNLIPGLQDSVNFYDGHHLNQQGVEKFNRHVVDWLCTLGYDSPGLHD